MDCIPGPRIGLLGCGTVGAAVVRGLPEPWRLHAVAVRDPDRPRQCQLPAELVTTSALTVANDPDVDVVVEVLGGIEPARACVLSALASGTPVITANKALLGSEGPELRAVAARWGVPLHDEAAVAGAVPVLRTLTGYLAGDRIRRIEGVLNGTATSVLSAMAADGVEMDVALAAAARLGYAEADATRDIDGTDAADKLAIIAQLTWGHDLRTADVQRQGIGWITPADIRRATRRGRVWRLVAVATEDGCAVVEPRDLRADHPLARLQGAEAGVVIQAERAGRLTLTGAGAGGDATAAAILADLATLRADPHPAAPVGVAARR